MTPQDCKRLIETELARRDLSVAKLTAKTVSFEDLARASCIFVTVHGWTPNPQADGLTRFAKDHGFRVQFS